jgi:hypothetical protein
LYQNQQPHISAASSFLSLDHKNLRYLNCSGQGVHWRCHRLHGGTPKPEQHPHDQTNSIYPQTLHYESQFIGFGIKALTNGIANNVLALLDQAWVTV